MNPRSVRLALVASPFITAIAAAVGSDVTLVDTARFTLWTLGWWVIGAAVVARWPIFPVRGRFATAAYGGCIGIIAQLLAWALMVGLGCGRYLDVLLLAALAAVLTVPTIRRCLFRAVCGHQSEGAQLPIHDEALEPIPTTALGSWSLGSTTLCLAAGAFFRVQTLPPQLSSMYQDLYWHLGIAAELKRQVLPQVVESRTGRLNYHWLSDAYMAAGSLGAQVPTMYIAARLWLLPVLLLAPALLILVGRQIIGSWSGSWLAVLLTTLGASLPVLPWQSLGPSATYVLVSPSQVFGVPMTLLAMSCMVRFYRRGRLGTRAFVAFTVVGFVCAGSKSSILPVLLGGTCCALVASASGGTPLSRARRRVSLGLLVSELIALGAVTPLFAGGSAGSQIRLLGHLRHWEIVTRVTGHPHAVGHGPFIPPGLDVRAVVVLAALIIAILLSYGLGSFSLLLGRDVWTQDAVPSVLAGSVLSSVAAFLLVDHTGQSESYFPMGAMPLLALLAAWGWSHARDNNSRHRRVPVGLSVVVGLLLGAALFYLVPHQLPNTQLTDAELTLWFGLPFLVVCIIGVVFSVTARTNRYLPAFMALLVGLSVFASGQNFIRTTASGLGHRRHVTPTSITADEASAAFWVRDHTGASTLLGTNVHCLRIVRSKNCVSAAYWTSGLTERPMFVGSWGYTDAAQRNAGRGGQPAVNVPFPDQTAFDLNEAMFYAPNQPVADSLKAHGVRYLYADARVAPLAHDIARYAIPTYTSGPVTVYRLR